MSNQSNLWYFEESDLFEILCPRKTPGLEDAHTPDSYKKDDFIYFPEEASKQIYMISNGRVKIGTYTNDKKEIVKAILGHGEIFGELALTGEDRRTDFAQAMDGKTKICPMSITDLKALMKDNQSLSLKILRLSDLGLERWSERLSLLFLKMPGQGSLIF